MSLLTHSRFLRFCLALPLALWFTSARAQPPIVLADHDVRVELVAGPSAPRLASLASAGKTWRNDGDMPLIAQATIGGVAHDLHWNFDRASSRIERDRVDLVYVARDPDLRLHWQWRARAAFGPLEHSIRIENHGAKEVWLPLQDSLRFHFMANAGDALEQLWIDKGAGDAPPVGTHRVAIDDGYAWRGKSSAFAHPRVGEPREIIPFFLVRETKAGGGSWYAGVEFSGRVALNLERRNGAIAGSIGLDPEPQPFRTRLAAGESFAAPTVFVGAAGNDVDAAGNVLRRWIRTVLNDPATLRDPQYPLVTNNSWGSAMAISDAQAMRMIDDAHALGFEMFHMDAGWFRAVGDWRPDPAKFPHGLAAVADRAHKLGLKFGLWVDWAQAGISTEKGALSVNDPGVRDWLVTDPPPLWKPAEFKGMTIDIGVPAAQAWVERETDRIVRDYRVDMLEHDGDVVAQGCDRTTHAHAPVDPARAQCYVDDEFFWVDGDNSTDVSLHAVRAYYAIQDALKRRHPGLLLEICNDGGRMVDFGSAAHGDYFSIVDSYDPLSNRQAFYDASHVLPPAMLETYVKEWPAARIENFRYMLRSGMMGWFTVMIDTTRWTPEQRAAARAEIALYISTLRPLIRDADLYHVAACPDGKGWDGIEYFDAARGKGALYAFHGTGVDEKNYTFALKGLDSARRYRVHFRDGSSADFIRNGRELMRDGVTVNLPLPESSEIVLLEAM
jgi:hypothetical protein